MGGPPRGQVVAMTPAVMLSPKARKRVALERGTRVTDTWNPHVAVCCRLSRAVHVTGVVPTASELPVGGVQVVVTCPAPPVAVGAG